MSRMSKKSAGLVGAFGISLLLAGAIIAVPAAAQAGTIRESSAFYKTEFECNIGKATLKVQGYNVASRCTFNGVFESPWSFWYETK